MSSVHTHPVENHANAVGAEHGHDFLGANHQRNERKVWAVIALTAAMMGVEIVAGTVYGSMALVADGWHMATHAGALLITALAYRLRASTKATRALALAPASSVTWAATPARWCWPWWRWPSPTRAWTD